MAVKMFTCERCGHESKTKQAHTKHLARVKPCLLKEHVSGHAPCADKPERRENDDIGSEQEQVPLASASTPNSGNSSKHTRLSLSDMVLDIDIDDANVPVAMRTAFLMLMTACEDGGVDHSKFSATRPPDTDEFVYVEYNQEVAYYIHLMQDEVQKLHEAARKEDERDMKAVKDANRARRMRGEF